jgi:CBS domain-containing protein
MDGGRVFRALLAERLKFTNGTKYAAFIGRFLAILMAILGVALYNLGLIIIGVFIYIGASEEPEQTIVATTLARVRVKDLLHSEVAAVNPETSLADAMDVMFKARCHDALVEKEGSFLGVLTWGEIVKVKSEQRSSPEVELLPLKQISLFPDESVLETYKIMSKEKIDLVPVVDREAPNKILGVVTYEGVSYAFEKAKTLR